MDGCDGYEVTVYAAGVTEPVYRRSVPDLIEVVRLLRTVRAMTAPHVIARIEIVPWWYAGRAPRPGLSEWQPAATRPTLLPAGRAPVHWPNEVCDCPNPRPGRPWHCAATGDA